LDPNIHIEIVNKVFKSHIWAKGMLAILAKATGQKLISVHAPLLGTKRLA
jgi:hypothetical protein